METSKGGDGKPPRKGFRKCATCSRNRAERFFTKQGKTCSTCRKRTRSASTHEARVQATYGLEPGEYALLVDRQGGVCAICEQPRSYRLNVDHCHKSGLIRGALCRMCNGRLLTAARDNAQILRRAADYLENPPAPRFLGERYHAKDGKK
ncbi:endonuclease VII domain-containing protein [Streptomyces sp. BI20]|uniref:endonuclease VII domain-containing protein n=1 Tax=Streptomyces sp. BI20 TaxID=3403460 RepID=UPI003C756296